MEIGPPHPNPRPSTNAIGSSTGKLCTNGKTRHAEPAMNIEMLSTRSSLERRASAGMKARTSSSASAYAPITMPIFEADRPIE